MTLPKRYADMERPNRRVGDIVRLLLACPLCRQPDEQAPDRVRVVAYGRRSIGVACRDCGLRFTVDRPGLSRAIDSKPLASAMAFVCFSDDERREGARDSDRHQKAARRASARSPHRTDVGGHTDAATPTPGADQ